MAELEPVRTRSGGTRETETRPAGESCMLAIRRDPVRPLSHTGATTPGACARCKAACGHDNAADDATVSAQPDTGPEDVLRAAAAGDRAARGGLLRIAVYGAGVALTAAASAVLLRHLGVAAFGRYATVVALVTIAGGVADAGLTIVGQREYVLADADGRRHVLGAVAALRLVLAPVGVLAAALFALAVGYPGEMVAGTLIAGA